MGSWAADLLSLHGGKIVAVSDRTSCIHNEQGINVASLRRHMRASPPFGGHLSSFPGGGAVVFFSFLITGN